MSAGRTAPRWLKPATEYGPLGLFFIVYTAEGLLPATAVLLAATAVGLLLSLVFLRRLPMMPLVTALVVGIFGGLTLWLQDETFIKLKPTIVNAIFAVILLGGYAINRHPLQYVLGTSLQMTENGWRKLTLRLGLFFAAMAGLNEIVWRTQSTDVWVAFKVFGLIGLTVAFMLAQTPLIIRHRPRED
ncbi:MAG: septation protein A [Ferrovibrio sp.]|uniref:septation protein A n=1 Tax=Ferrovibrio sp. TaxID=1917215 RepID=UPI00262A6ADB|nr:septation protein A [Ferrovibrio sp.]MCW0232659.1 septation protein A [Ferrovibrio sp.]